LLLLGKGRKGCYLLYDKCGDENKCADDELVVDDKTADCEGEGE